MGTRGLYIVRFRKRYYVRYNQYDSYYEGLGAKVVASIPAEPGEYEEWLSTQREKYATLEKKLEECVYEIHKDVQPRYDLYSSYVALPSELPRLDGFDAEHTYIVNLDDEILTMDYTIHWKLGNIPRENMQWLHAIKRSIYSGRPTIHPDRCPEEYMACPAVPRTTQNKMRYKHVMVDVDCEITASHEVFRARMAAGVLAEYHKEIERFGLEWTPDALPFREIIYSLVSLAACEDNTRFHSFPSRLCNPRSCMLFHCNEPNFTKFPGYLKEKWVGARAPLCEFGSSAHFPNMPPGAAPVETTYWLGNVAVHLSLTVDNGSISDAVAWGWEQGRRHFQAVIISLFEVAFAEVKPRDTADNNDEPFVRVTDNYPLSPLTEKDCDSSHPRERPIRPSGSSGVYSSGRYFFLYHDERLNHDVLQSQFPGIAELVKFLDVAATRRAAVKADLGVRSSVRNLPPELYSQILDYTDYDTWKACLLVSPRFREQGLSRFRVDDRFCIMAGPFTRLNKYRKTPLLGFNFRDLHTGAVMPMIEEPRKFSISELNWAPILGRNGDRQELMLDMFVQFEPFEEAAEQDGKQKGGDNEQ
ncbi:hypothetical protein SPI_03593 [Niveomyces insectorum RCEF 264]|uniref:F-box domain-containing protein n=1 Tax=Niveomyces insectorum RCEF 264 TaxID=1081102 RepID=A0A162MKS4_9HYPO|nr:hypothetical protein SPI_03593 [Niveomyces insectorum RCEF 264]